MNTAFFIEKFFENHFVILFKEIAKYISDNSNDDRILCIYAKL